VSSGASGIGVYGMSSGGEGIGAEGSCNDTDCYGVYGNSNGNTGAYAGYFAGNLAYTGTIGHVSDERLKKNIQSLTGSVDKLLQLRGVSFEWRNPSKHGGTTSVRRGFIAQEFEKVFPEWVTTGRDGFKIIDDSGVIAVAVEAIRTLKTQLDTANAKNNALEDRVRTLENGGHPVVGAMGNFGGVGTGNLALSLLTLAGAYAISRKKKAEATS
jgi:Chaperone of endosialidase